MVPLRVNQELHYVALFRRFIKIKEILRDALFFINLKKINNTVEIAITGIYTHHETIRNVHMYKQTHSKSK